MRRLRRFRTLKRRARPSFARTVSLKMVPYKEGPEAAGPSLEDVTKKVLEQSGLKQTVESLRQNMSEMQRASANLNRQQSVQMLAGQELEVAKPSLTGRIAGILPSFTAKVGRGLSMMSPELRTKSRHNATSAGELLPSSAPKHSKGAAFTFTGEIMAANAAPRCSEPQSQATAPTVLGANPLGADGSRQVGGAQGRAQLVRPPGEVQPPTDDQ